MQEKTSLPKLNNGSKIIYGCVVGSYAYGTNVEDSIKETRWVYVQSAEDLFVNGYKAQILVDKYTIIYELTRILELAEKANPTILEILYSPKDCVLYSHKVFTYLLNMRREFLTKQCKYSFIGYAEDQLEKASGTKRVKWEKEDIDRKSILEYCYFVSNKLDPSLHHARFQSNSILKNFARSEIGRMGLSVVPHTKSLYNLFWDAATDFEGICKEEYATDIQVSVIPEKSNCVGLMYFDKESYNKHCENNRNYKNALVDDIMQCKVGYNPPINGKNLAEGLRIIDTAQDIAEFREVIVKRENAEYLKQVQKGIHNLEHILISAKREIERLKASFEHSTIPDKYPTPFILKVMNSSIRRELHGEFMKESEKTY